LRVLDMSDYIPGGRRVNAETPQNGGVEARALGRSGEVGNGEMGCVERVDDGGRQPVGGSER
jgi:hypothetical protein